mmetsp:Transcript_1185/g.3466  ORF Transcript_1185/g.3466 Transcript_1185/m.3466 type:complete len:157 (-) Transcript_1185:2511-2981(-)
MNIGKSFISGVGVYAVLPNFSRATFAAYTSFWSFFVGGSSWDEYLYTAQGSQVGVLQQNDYDKLGLSESSALAFDNTVPTMPLTRLRPSAIFNSLAGFEENRWYRRRDCLLLLTRKEQQGKVLTLITFLLRCSSTVLRRSGPEGSPSLCPCPHLFE